MTISLEDAWAVINASREAVRVAEFEERKKLVGKFFKYRNSYSSDEKWWLYIAVTGVTDDERDICGISFQRPTDGRIEIERRAHLISVGRSAEYIEITAHKFWQEAAACLEEAQHVLTER